MTSAINSFKITLACLLSFVLAHVFHLPLGQLVVISALLVMIGNDDFGSTLKKSYIRLLGAGAGSVIALFSLTIWGYDVLIDYLIFGTEIFGFALLINGSKKIQAGGMFGALTLISILLSDHPCIQIVYTRLLEILLGIVIALCISKWVYPVHTKERLQNLLSHALLQLGALYQVKFCAVVCEIALKNPYKHETKILRLFGDQERLLLGAVMKRREKQWIIELYERIILSERGIFRGSLFLSRVSQLNHQLEKEVQTLSTVIAFHQMVAQFIQQLGQAGRVTSNLSRWSAQLDSALEDLAIDLLNKAELILPRQQVYLHTYIGSCEYVCYELKTLIELMVTLDERVYKKPCALPEMSTIY